MDDGLPPLEERKKYSKTKPIQVEKFEDIKKWWNKRNENDNAWKVKLKTFLLTDCEGKLLNVNLDVKNPNRKSDLEYREPTELISSIVGKEKKVMVLMEEIENLISEEVSAK